MGQLIRATAINPLRQRLAEVAALEVADISNERMLIRVERGKVVSIAMQPHNKPYYGK